MSSEPKDIFYSSLFYGDTQHQQLQHQHQQQGHEYFNMVPQMGYSDCLNGGLFMDYGVPPPDHEVVFSSSIEDDNTQKRDLGSENIINTQISSISSDNNEDTACVEEDSKVSNQSKPSDDAAESSSKKNGKSPGKKKEKKEKEPRFAFMTKSEVDHLEDGYRWRKYGQKAVKNSPYPRSYYRCTTQKCSVKKRVERSFQDPTIVITTYEGQHNHLIPTTLRGNAAAMLNANSASSTLNLNFPQEWFGSYLPSIHNNQSTSMYPQNNFNPSHLDQFQQLHQYGLFHDISSPSVFPKQSLE